MATLNKKDVAYRYQATVPWKLQFHRSDSKARGYDMVYIDVLNIDPMYCWRHASKNAVQCNIVSHWLSLYREWSQRRTNKFINDIYLAMNRSIMTHLGPLANIELLGFCEDLTGISSNARNKSIYIYVVIFICGNSCLLDSNYICYVMVADLK